jgi:hypothetical protein
MRIMVIAVARRVGLWAVLAALLLSALPARACNVPVFRYALERWPADPYEVILFHRGPLDPADKALADALTKHAEAEPSPVNFTFEREDLAKVKDKEMLKQFEEQYGTELPLLVVRYPESSRLKEKAWAGPFNPRTVRKLFDSPARRELVRRLLAGDSAVWILLECGDRAKDDAAEKLLTSELLKLQRTLKLPELTADPDDRLSPKGPDLKLAFSLLRLSRTDPAEELFVHMLLHLDTDLVKSKEPMAFAVFGRGRALSPLIGAGINAEHLGSDARFVTGPCTCKVKEQNPGVDLLVLADWDGSPGRQPAIYLPGDAVPPMPSADADAVAHEPASGPPLLRNVLLAGAGGVVLVGALTFLLMRKSKGLA